MTRLSSAGVCTRLCACKKKKKVNKKDNMETDTKMRTCENLIDKYFKTCLNFLNLYILSSPHRPFLKINVDKNTRHLFIQF